MLDDIYSTTTAPPWLDPDAPVVPCADGGLYADAWFPEPNDSPLLAREAKRLCGQCPLQAECLSWSQAEHVAHGIFGGVNAKDRGRLRRRAA